MIIPVLHHRSNMFIGIPWEQFVVEENSKRWSQDCVSALSNTGVLSLENMIWLKLEN